MNDNVWEGKTGRAGINGKQATAPLEDFGGFTKKKRRIGIEQNYK